MPQYVGAVYLDVRFDPQQAQSALRGTMAQAGSAAGGAAGDAVTSQLSDRLLKFGTQATRIGRQLSFGLSVPLGALGGAAEKAFLAYDTNLTKVAALTGVGADQTNKWSAQVLDLASKYGVAGEDAAQALYLISSSGIKGQQAIDTLDVALKASAVGMGDAATVANLLTSAMNAYGPANLSAAQAADILTGAVQESKIPADQLAGSISQLLPFGNQLGVSFAQITGSMAALSLQGTNAAQAATQLRGIFAGLLDPSAQAAQAFSRVGLSADQLRATLEKQGIVAMIRQLRDAIVKNGGEADTELANVFGNVRALTGAFGLLSNQGGQIDRVMEHTANSAGKLNSAFLVTADSGAFQAKQATEAMHNELIQLGESVAPVVTALAKVAGAGLEVVNALGPARYVLAAIGAGLVILGPAAYTIGAIADVAGLMAATFNIGATAATRQTLAISALEAAQARLAAAELAVADAGATEVVSVNLAGETIVTTSTEAAAAQAELAAAAHAVAEAEAEVAASGAAAAEGEAAAATGAAAFAAAALPMVGIAAAVAGGFAIWNKRMENAQNDADALGDTFSNKIAKGGIKDANDTIAKTQAQIKDLSDDVENSHAPWDADYRAEIQKGIETLNAHVAATQADIDMAQRLSAQTGESGDKLLQWISNERNANRTYKTSEEALAAYTKAMAAHGDVVSTATTGTGKLVDKAKELSDKFFGATSAQKAYADALTKVDDANRSAADADRAVGDARRGVTDAVQKVTDAQQKYRDALDGVVDAQRKLTEAQKAYNEEAKGPTKDETLDLRQAQLNLRKARHELSQPVTDPTDTTTRQQRRIDLQRAQVSLTEAQGAHAKNLAKAQADVVDAQKGLTSAQRNAVDAAKAITDAQRGVEDAHRKVDDAVRAAKKAHEDVGQAELDAAGAANALTQKQSELADAINKSKDGAKPLVDYLSQLKDLYPEAAGGIQQYLDKAIALQNFYNAQHPPPPDDESHYGTNDPTMGSYQENATGGPVSRGQLSSVNEMGLPELWSQNGKQFLLPLTSGHVVPLKPVDLPIRGGDGASAGDTINVYEMSGKPRQTAYEVRRELRKEKFLSGRRA